MTVFVIGCVIAVPVSLVCLNAPALNETRSHLLNPSPLASLSTPDVAALEEQGGSSERSAAGSESGSKNDGSSTSFNAMEREYGVPSRPMLFSDDTNGDERSATGLLDAMSLISSGCRRR